MAARHGLLSPSRFNAPPAFRAPAVRRRPDTGRGRFQVHIRWNLPHNARSLTEMEGKKWPESEKATLRVTKGWKRYRVRTPVAAETKQAATPRAAKPAATPQTNGAKKGSADREGQGGPCQGVAYVAGAVKARWRSRRQPRTRSRRSRHPAGIRTVSQPGQRRGGNQKRSPKSTSA